jgi:hypothetical protein
MKYSSYNKIYCYAIDLIEPEKPQEREFLPKNPQNLGIPGHRVPKL